VERGRRGQRNGPRRATNKQPQKKLAHTNKNKKKKKNTEIRDERERKSLDVRVSEGVDEKGSELERGVLSADSSCVAVPCFSPPVIAPLEERAFLHAPYETAAEAGGAGNETGGEKGAAQQMGNNKHEGTREQKSERQGTERAGADEHTAKQR
jgi:hypothetical protein